MRRLTIATAIGIAALIVAYFVSPYWALHQIRTAAKAGDGDRVAAYVDFPAVRESIKVQLASALATRLEAQPKAGPLASFGQAFATSMMGGLVDAMVTPEGISTMIRSGKAPHQPLQAKPTAPPPNEERRSPKVRQGYQGLDTFEATLIDPDSNDEVMNAILSRQGLFSWKLTALRLPALLKR